MSAAPPVISIRGLSHSYGEGEQRRQILRAVDLTVAPGEVVVIGGPSGSGKTTLLTLCGALRSVQEGEVSVAGRGLNGLSADQQRELRGSIGFVFQSHNLIDALTAGQNVVMSLLGRFPPAQAESMAEAALESLGLLSRVDAFPEELSGGERQRVAVARALVRSPELILADEPTASLDNASAAAVIESIKEAARRTSCAVLLVTHDPRVLPIADRSLQLDGGKLFEHAGRINLRSVG
ncbi:ATP-binding cassette domain-containing protein [Steroidobacter sp.]|uniref:ATP-binding cassette domain-containing protein n=1 Tax=Steroidobacter sp. TaxID=1978227 RepID=UPI001A5FEDFD|nr:ATP-binding cassette domain-containing protein [Steroidobacter sp.]MBL8266137.1 ATP-binding cassette domain-containing protein [Steroidobacter sp.]